MRREVEEKAEADAAAAAAALAGAAADVRGRYSAFERLESEGGTQRSFVGSLPASCTSDTSGVSNPTLNCEGEVLPCSALGKMPCVRRCRFAFERTAKLFVHVGIGHLNAV